MTSPSSSQIAIGVLAIRRKLGSKPMQSILKELTKLETKYNIIELDEHIMNNLPVNQWPVTDVLLTLYSPKLPFQKVLRYISLRSPLLVNNIHMQPTMMDRRLIRRVLKRAGVPIPPAIYLNRSDGDTVIQSNNSLIIHSPSRHSTYTIDKPFVEKPVDPENHNVHIYYEDGGVRKLFRKVKNQSSVYEEERKEIRKQGDFIYEKFFEPSESKDIKIYGVGKTYFYAETRKAPHVDGIVERDVKGYERRQHIELTQSEYNICSKISDAFDQFIIGFDLLRSGDKYFVIDVNGWSLVKNNPDYIHNCSVKLSNHILQKLHERHSLHIRALSLAPSPSNAATDLAVMIVLNSYNTINNKKDHYILDIIRNNTKYHNRFDKDTKGPKKHRNNNSNSGNDDDENNSNSNSNSNKGVSKKSEDRGGNDFKLEEHHHHLHDFHNSHQCVV